MLDNRKKLFESIVFADYSNVVNRLVGIWDSERYEKNYVMVYVYDKDFNVVDKVEMFDEDEEYEKLLFIRSSLQDSHSILTIDFPSCFIKLKKEHKRATTSFADESSVMNCIALAIKNHPLCDYVYNEYGFEGTFIVDKQFYNAELFR